MGGPLHVTKRLEKNGTYYYQIIVNGKPATEAIAFNTPKSSDNDDPMVFAFIGDGHQYNHSMQKGERGKIARGFREFAPTPQIYALLKAGLSIDSALLINTNSGGYALAMRLIDEVERETGGTVDVACAMGDETGIRTRTVWKQLGFLGKRDMVYIAALRSFHGYSNALSRGARLINGNHDSQNCKLGMMLREVLSRFFPGFAGGNLFGSYETGGVPIFFSDVISYSGGINEGSEKWRPGEGQERAIMEFLGRLGEKKFGFWTGHHLFSGLGIDSSGLRNGRDYGRGITAEAAALKHAYQSKIRGKMIDAGIPVFCVFGHDHLYSSDIDPEGLVCYLDAGTPRNSNANWLRKSDFRYAMQGCELSHVPGVLFAFINGDHAKLEYRALGLLPQRGEIFEYSPDGRIYGKVSSSKSFGFNEVVHSLVYTHRNGFERTSPPMDDRIQF